jgi:hypothetical protein
MGIYETQQKVIEVALDKLDNSPKPVPVLSREEELWMLVGKSRMACLIQKEGMKVLLETVDLDRFRGYVAEQKPLEFTAEVHNQKALRDCSLKEILEALIINGQVSNQLDSIDYKDMGDHYIMKMTHNMGINYSKTLLILHESLLNSYGAKFDSNMTGRSLFIRIFKDE